MIAKDDEARFAGRRFLMVLGQSQRIGGAEQQAMLLARQLREVIGAEVDFLAWGEPGDLAERLQTERFPVHSFPLDWPQSSWKKFSRLFKLASFIREVAKPEFLLPFIGFNCKIIGTIWRRTGASFTWWNQRDEGRGVFGSRWERRVISGVPAVVSNSFEGRDFLTRTFQIPSHSVAVINNGVLPAGQTDSRVWRRRLNLGDDDRLITMVANLTRFKDHQTLVKAFADLRSDDSTQRVHLCLAGRHGETADRLKVAAFDEGLGGVMHLPGVVDDVPNLLAASDFVVHSSVHEGCPNAVLEAMANRKAVCGTDISGMRQALGPNHDGVLAAPHDPQSLARIMSQLLADPSRRARLEEQNVRRIQTEFSLEQLRRKVLGVIHGAVVNTAA